jgi:hypothetical protein
VGGFGSIRFRSGNSTRPDHAITRFLLIPVSRTMQLTVFPEARRACTVSNSACLATRVGHSYGGSVITGLPVISELSRADASKSSPRRNFHGRVTTT